MSAIPMPPEQDEDRAHDERAQRDLDDAAEKRRASGYSPEELSLAEAFIEGARAGNMELAPSLNPYQDFCPEHAEWLRGWHSTAAAGRRAA
jgi:hypothetical protein